ncbi:transcription factor TFIIE complex alpha subunit [Aspergillus campestris IBT 28561]|uniref:Transcription factor TFIIE complex alpha subunit n=1 Tax=Aspergillus campestris (strain IBT 28561) TaxID=1392248 RepID=A0A2I1D424_ASPC2|nr:transcription factor TFIIE complex alpha subunit [Aspergillus campestris IBT 28561]PKY04619.1 transcription factor TFIIE complex alpha subunit [Aspergillus campestris IBT 28561]
MDLASTLIRSVARAFYETRHILVVDALFIHSVLHAEDLAFLLGMQQKDLRKLCAKLREDRLIAVSTRAEIRDGATRPVNREYYYIPLHPVVDAIKYKVSRLTSTIKAQYTPSEDRKEYICLRCGTEWTELDVLSLYSEEGFECQNCGAILERTEDVKGAEGIDRTGHEKNSKLMAQLDQMLKLLKQIDSVEIPPNDFDTAWDHKVDVVRNQQINPTRAAIVVPPKQQDAVRGNAKTDTSALEISLTSTAEKTAAEQAAEAARKAAVEKQNALPVWHTHSTVSTAAGNGSRVKTETDVDVKPEIKDEEDQKPSIDELDDKVAAYYAEMEREKALQAQEDASSAEDESDEFDEEFEDVGGVSASDAASPAVGGGAPTSAPSATSGSGIKRELDMDSGTSSPQTGATPSTAADGPAAKKIKTEPEIKTEPGIKREEPAVKKEESDEDDDEEFEDV